MMFYLLGLAAGVGFMVAMQKYAWGLWLFYTPTMVWFALAFHPQTTGDIVLLCLVVVIYGLLGLVLSLDRTLWRG